MRIFLTAIMLVTLSVLSIPNHAEAGMIQQGEDETGIILILGTMIVGWTLIYYVWLKHKQAKENKEVLDYWRDRYDGVEKAIDEALKHHYDVLAGNSQKEEDT